MSRNGNERRDVARKKASMLSMEKGESIEEARKNMLERSGNEAWFYAQEARRTRRVLEALEAIVSVMAQKAAGQITEQLLACAGEPFSEQVEQAPAVRCVEVIRHILACHFVLLAEFSLETELLSPLACAGISPAYDLSWGSSLRMQALLRTTGQFERLCAGEVLSLDLPDPASSELSAHRTIAPIIQQKTLIGIIFLDYGAQKMQLSLDEITLIKSISQIVILIVQREKERRERECALQTLRVTHEEILRMNTQKNNFIATVNHEFRTVLMGIQGASEIIRDQELGLDTIKEFAIDIHADARRLVHMINDMLELEQIASGQVDLCLEWLNLNTLITSVVKRLRSTAPHHRIGLHLASVMPLLLGDRDKLTLVIANLLRNVFEYAAPQGSDIIVSSQVEANRIHVSLAIQGIGIAISDLKRIFERYSPGTTKQPCSIGAVSLDFSIAQKIIQMHGGQVWAESQQNYGSAFHFTVCYTEPLPA